MPDSELTDDRLALDIGHTFLEAQRKAERIVADAERRVAELYRSRAAMPGAPLVGAPGPDRATGMAARSLLTQLDGLEARLTASHSSLLEALDRLEDDDARSPGVASLAPTAGALPPAAEAAPSGVTRSDDRVRPGMVTAAPLHSPDPTEALDAPAPADVEETDREGGMDAEDWRRVPPGGRAWPAPTGAPVDPTTIATAPATAGRGARRLPSRQAAANRPAVVALSVLLVLLGLILIFINIV